MSEKTSIRILAAIGGGLYLAPYRLWCERVSSAQWRKASRPSICCSPSASEARYRCCSAGFAYYEHRIDTADINQLTYATVEQKLEGELEARADSVSKATGALARPGARFAATAPLSHRSQARLLEERDIERVEVTDAHGAVLFAAAIRAIPPTTIEPFVVKSSIPRGRAGDAAGGSLQIWVSRGEMQDTLASIRAQLEHQQGNQIKRMRGMLAGITLPLLALGLIGAWFIARQLAQARFRP